MFDDQLDEQKFFRILTCIQSDIKLLSNLEEVSGLIENEYPIGEYVYRFDIHNKNDFFLIYSSIAKTTTITREKGKDAVRIVLYIYNSKGGFYKSVGKCYRVRKLLENLSNKLQKAIAEYL